MWHHEDAGIGFNVFRAVVRANASASLVPVPGHFNDPGIIERSPSAQDLYWSSRALFVHGIKQRCARAAAASAKPAPARPARVDAALTRRASAIDSLRGGSQLVLQLRDSVLGGEVQFLQLRYLVEQYLRLRVGWRNFSMGK